MIYKFLSIDINFQTFIKSTSIRIVSFEVFTSQLLCANENSWLLLKDTLQFTPSEREKYFLNSSTWSHKALQRLLLLFRFNSFVSIFVDCQNLIFSLTSEFKVLNFNTCKWILLLFMHFDSLCTKFHGLIESKKTTTAGIQQIKTRSQYLEHTKHKLLII